MVSINVKSGNGITQAIAEKLKLSDKDLKKINIATWQNVMTEVKNAQEQINQHNSTSTDKQKSIFTGTSDVSAINKKSSNNFLVHAGDIEIDDSVWNKIVTLLKPDSAPKVEHKQVTKQEESVKRENVTMEPLSDNTPKLNVPKSEVVTPEIKPTVDINKNAAKSLIDSIDGKTLVREVNGKKTEISVATVDGQKIRREINEDGTLGDNLVTVSTAGKNKYITQTEYENKVRTALGLGENDEIPKDIKAEFVNIGGAPTLIFKKDGKTLDAAGMREYVNNLKEQKYQAAINFDKVYSKIGQADISNADELAKSQIALINDKYGDKKGGVNSDEYFNYELQTAAEFFGGELDDEGKAQFRALSDINFGLIDETGDGEITAEELAKYLRKADGNKDKSLTQKEVEDYTNGEILKQMQNDMQAGIDQAIKDGFKAQQEPDGTIVYIKDGKKYQVMENGSVGAEIKTSSATITTADPVKSSPNNVKSMTTQELSDYLSKDEEYITAFSEYTDLVAEVAANDTASEEAFKSMDVEKFKATGGREAMDKKVKVELMEQAINQYKDTVSNWEEGKKFHYTTGSMANIEIEQTTLNGRKVYKCIVNENGKKMQKYFAVNLDIKNGIGKDLGKCLLSEEVNV